VRPMINNFRGSQSALGTPPRWSAAAAAARDRGEITVGTSGGPGCRRVDRVGGRSDGTGRDGTRVVSDVMTGRGLGWVGRGFPGVSLSIPPAGPEGFWVAGWGCSARALGVCLDGWTF
jgi:hypothetical protein